MIVIKKDVTDDSPPLLQAEKFDSGGLLISDGVFASQVPDHYGKFETRNTVGPWEQVKVNGQLITFKVVDKAYTYSWTETPY